MLGRPMALHCAVALLVLVNKVIADDLGDPGPYQTATTVVSVDKPGGSSFYATVYFPSDGNGGLDGSGEHPLIAFGHGYIQGADAYTSTLTHLASQGYVVIATQDMTGLFPNHQDFADELKYSIDYMASANSTTGSIFYGGIDMNEVGVAGHSLGGGVALVEAANDPRVKAVMALAPSNTFTSPSAENQASNIDVPVRILVGSADVIASAQYSSQPIYNNAYSPKQMITMEGGGHLSFEDEGYVSADGTTLARADQQDIARRELTTFFDFYLKQDESLWKQVWGPEAAPSPYISSFQSDSGIELSATESSLLGDPGSAIVFDVTLTNNTRGASTFDLFIDDSSWSASTISTSPLLQPGESTTFSVAVMPPTNALLSQDMLLLSARSGHDDLTRGYTYLTAETTAVPEARGSLLLTAATIAAGSLGFVRRRSIQASVLS